MEYGTLKEVGRVLLYNADKNMAAGVISTRVYVVETVNPSFSIVPANEATSHRYRRRQSSAMVIELKFTQRYRRDSSRRMVL